MKNFGINDALVELGLKKKNYGSSTGTKWYKSSGEWVESYSPVDGKLVGKVQAADEKTYNLISEQSVSAYKEWRKWPAPKRGEIVRQVGEALRNKKESLGRLVSYEMGKSLQEGLGEVQE